MHTRSDRTSSRSARKGTGIGPALAAAALLAGCSTVSETLGMSDPSAGLACPKVAIVRDAQDVTLFRPGGRDLTDILARAQLADFNGGCDYDSKGVTVDLDLSVVAEKGPAFQGNDLPLRYFVAIAAPDRTVIAKREFDTAISFPSGASRAGNKEELRQSIPLPKGQDARDYQVLLGVQLTPEQLEYNRDNRDAVRR